MFMRFPGMDPFLEAQRWQDFHTRFLTVFADALMPSLLPNYVAVIEARVYVEHSLEERVIQPDVAIVRSGSAPPRGKSAAVMSAPVEVPLALPETVKERSVEIRRRDTGQVVAVIELLSPSNKRSNSDGHREYKRKRELILLSASHLVEIDLLRGGERLPMGRPLPPADYYVIVSREGRRPMAEVWPISLRQALPTIPIPLAKNDPDVTVGLQEVFEAVHTRAGYAHTLDYSTPLDPPLSPEDAEWLRSLNG